MRNGKVFLSVAGGLFVAAVVTVLFVLGAGEKSAQGTSETKEGELESPLFV